MMSKSILANEIYNSLKGSPGMEEHTDLASHAKRYERLLATVSGLLPRIETKGNERVTLLDVGPWWQTAMFRLFLDVHLNTLGLNNNPPIDKPRNGECYYQQDLNRAVFEEYRDDIPSHDIVIMAEVIEHLPIAPTHMLRKIKRYIKPGGFLVLTTPNAVSLKKRFELLKGRVPYNLIKEDPRYPSHFREYTVPELIEFARICGYSLISHQTTDDWHWRYSPALSPKTRFGQIKRAFRLRVHEAIGIILPATFKESITIVLTC